MGKVVALFFILLLSACTGMPDKVVPVSDFEVNKYLGKWYEIARLDHSFERGLNNITAQYSLREDGGIEVLNRGFSVDEQVWNEAKGKAYFVRKPNEGYLKVSFFGPFYGSYIVFGLDKDDYQYAFISGPNLSYLWLLSREPAVSKEVMNRFMQQSSELGFDVSQLIFVEHNLNRSE